MSKSLGNFHFWVNYPFKNNLHALLNYNITEWFHLINLNFKWLIMKLRKLINRIIKW